MIKEGGTSNTVLERMLLPSKIPKDDREMRSCYRGRRQSLGDIVALAGCKFFHSKIIKGRD